MTEEVYILDMDGLLVDSEPLWRIAEIKAFGEAGIELTDNDCRKTMGMRIDAVAEYWLNRFETAPGYDVETISNRIVEHMRELLEKEVELMPGVLELIESAEKRGLKIAIASSSYKVLIETVVNKFGWEEIIPIQVSGQDVQRAKPHPEIFLKTAEKLEVNPGFCTVFEDSLNGVIAAKAASMKAIAVPDSEQLNDVRFQIADGVFESLIGYLHNQSVEL